MKASSPRLLVALVLGVTPVLGACIEPLDPKDVVVGPRVLDVIADRPELNPGGSTTLRVLLAGHSGEPTYRWYACLSSDATRSGMSFANFGESNTFGGCFGDGGANLPLGNGATATFVAPPNALSNLELLAARFGSQLPPGVATALARDIGIVVGVAVEVTVDGQTIQAYKRVVISSNPRPNTNPPPPRVRLNNAWITVRSGEDERCVREDGMPLRIGRGQVVNFNPDPDEERWFERYRVLTASGQLVDRSESAFYSWYVTRGRMARQLTRAPTRDNYWWAPETAGPTSFWILLRDGHGGTSGCRLDLPVD